MKNKTVLVLLVTLSATVFMFIGCEKKENDTVPVVSEAVKEVQTAEPEEVVESVEEDTAPIKDTAAEEELAEETILTQKELDELKANAPTDQAKENVEIYEAITNSGSWTDESGTYTKVVGKPDGSWRRMTDEEAQAIVDTGAMTKEAFLAQCEIEGTSFIRVIADTVYLDAYAYREAVDKGAFDDDQPSIEDVEWSDHVIE